MLVICFSCFVEVKISMQIDLLHIQLDGLVIYFSQEFQKYDRWNCFGFISVHTMEELKLTGNHLKGSRPILSFSSNFDKKAHWKLLKEMIIQVCVLSACLFWCNWCWPYLCSFLPPLTRQCLCFIHQVIYFDKLSIK